MKINSRQLIPNLKTGDEHDLCVTGIGYERTISEKESQTVKHNAYYGLHFVLSGKGYLVDGDKTYEISKNSIFLLFPNGNYRYYPDQKTPWTYCWMLFHGLLIPQIYRDLGLVSDKPVFQIDRECKISDSILNCVADCSESFKASQYLAHKCFYEVVLKLRKFLMPHETSVKKKNTVDLSPAIDFIKTHYAESDLNLRMVAAHINLNSDYFGRLFHADTGANFRSYLNQLRVSKALELMQNGETSVAEISEKVGFVDPFYFTKVFKNNVKMPPSEFIKKDRDAHAPSDPARRQDRAKKPNDQTP